jgi:hypothetical protein
MLRLNDNLTEIPPRGGKRYLTQFAGEQCERTDGDSCAYLFPKPTPETPELADNLTSSGSALVVVHWWKAGCWYPVRMKKDKDDSVYSPSSPKLSRSSESGHRDSRGIIRTPPLVVDCCRVISAESPARERFGELET